MGKKQFQINSPSPPGFTWGPSRIFVLALLASLLSFTTDAAEVEPGIEVSEAQIRILSLTPGQSVGRISEYAYLLETPGGRDLSAVLQADNVYIRNTGEFINPGTTQDLIWVRVDVENTTEQMGEWIVSLNRVLVSDVGLFFVREGNTQVLLDDSSASMVESYREYRTLAGRLTLPPDSAGQIYIRYRGANWSGLSPLLATEQSFQAEMMTDLVIFFVLLGGMATLVAIGSISFLFIGREVVAYYALAQIAFFAFYTHFTGISTVYLFPEQAQSLRFVSPLTLGLFIVFICQFTRCFFETSTRLPKIDKLFRGLVATVCFAFLLTLLSYAIPVIDDRLPLILFYLASIVTWVVLPSLALYATFRWQGVYWPLVVAWTSTGVFMLTMQFVWLGLVSVMPLEENIFGVVIYVEAAFLALAISLRIRMLREEALLAERQLSQSLLAELKASERAKRLYEEREWALQDLAEKGRLLLTAGHDTRQMISALRNYSAGIRMASAGEKVEQATHKIDDIVENLNEVLTTAVEGSRSGGITDSTLALDTVKPEKILNAVVLIHSSSAREKNIEIATHVSAGPMVTDRVLVGRVLGNFLSNAIKYSRDGRIVLACRPYKGGHRFQVWDQGRGIAPADLDNLLDPGTSAIRLNADTEGLGSGLAIVKILAARLGVRIDARSVPGRGSVFELIHPGISWPVAESEEPGSDYSIVLADSDASQSEVFIQTLSGTGLAFESLVGLDNSSVQDEVVLPAADLLFVDEHFGGANKGLQLARRHSERNPEAKVLLLSFNRSIEARMEMAKSASLILYKPLSSSAIRAAIAFATLSNAA